MNYNDFIIEYPIFDLMFEIFKGVVPTIIAIIAIVINNKRARKRDLEKLKKDNDYRIYSEIKNNSIEINNLIFQAMISYFRYISASDNDKEEKFNKHQEVYAELLFLANRITTIAYIEFEKEGIVELSFLECFERLKKYSGDLSNIGKEFKEKVKENPEKKSEIEDDWLDENLSLLAGELNILIEDYTYKVKKRTIDIK